MTGGMRCWSAQRRKPAEKCVRVSQKRTGSAPARKKKTRLEKTRIKERPRSIRGVDRLPRQNDSYYFLRK